MTYGAIQKIHSQLGKAKTKQLTHNLFYIYVFTRLPTSRVVARSVGIRECTLTGSREDSEQLEAQGFDSS